MRTVSFSMYMKTMPAHVTSMRASAFYEGVLRDAAKREDNYCNLHLMSMLEGETAPEKRQPQLLKPPNGQKSITVPSPAPYSRFTTFAVPYTCSCSPITCKLLCNGNDRMWHSARHAFSGGRSSLFDR